MKYLLFIFLLSCSNRLQQYRTIEHYKGMTVVVNVRTGEGFLLDTIIKPGVHFLDITDLK